MDISHREHVEKELYLLITRHDEKRRAEEDERPAEELWMEVLEREDVVRNLPRRTRRRWRPRHASSTRGRGKL